MQSWQHFETQMLGRSTLAKISGDKLCFTSQPGSRKVQRIIRAGEYGWNNQKALPQHNSEFCFQCIGKWFFYNHARCHIFEQSLIKILSPANNQRALSFTTHESRACFVTCNKCRA